MPIKYTIMNRIKDVLKEKGISVAEFADMLGVSRQALSKQLSGKLLLETLEKFASTLNVPVWQLLISSEDIKGNKNDLTALIQHKGDFYKASTIEELEKIVAEIKNK